MLRTSRKTTRFLSIFFAAIATITFLSSCWPSSSNGPQGGAELPKDVAAELASAFPIGKAQYIDFRADEDSFQTLTKREKADQLRDWLLFGIAADCSLSTNDITQSLYDLSPVRHGYIKPVSNFEYGDTRSLYIGNGIVLALLPKGQSDSEKKDSLAHIADKHRKNLGAIPETLLVFVYNLNVSQQYASLTQNESIAANRFFTSGEDGYYQAEIGSLEDLQQFMSSVDDLTFAQLQETGLVLGGRKLQSRQYKGIGVEDIAAIWQSEKSIETKLRDFEPRWNSPINTSPESTPEGMKAQAQPEARQLKLVKGSGFSLDPEYDLQGMLKTLEETKTTLLNEISWPEQELKNVASDLQQDEETSFLSLVDRVKSYLLQQNYKTGDINTANILKTFLNSPETHSYQAARYNGELKGTEVGMVLFYTDLLAKLWALDYQDTTPESIISDFQPLTKITTQISSIYQQEIETLPDTRLWFGPQDKGFQVANDNNLLFARNSTRVYAKSSDRRKSEGETTANAASEAFLEWWNDHYEEIATYEPQYERLNEIMKWSLLISWLNHSGNGSQLSFFQNETVNHNNWFPDWFRSNQSQLRFQDWSSIKFYKKGEKGAIAEAMPLLNSDSYQAWGKTRYIKGGVSLASRGLFKKSRTLPSDLELDPISFRSNIDYGSIEKRGTNVSFKDLDGTSYSLNTNSGALQAKAIDSAKLRGRDSELANLDFARNVSSQGSRLEITTSVAGTELGRLHSERKGNGFTVGWQSRDIDKGHILARKLSEVEPAEAEKILQEHSEINSVVQPNDGAEHYLVNFKGTKKWLELVAGDGGASIPPDFISRVGSSGDDGAGSNSSYLLAWLDDDVAQKEMAAGSAKVIRGPPTDKAIPIDVFSKRADQLALVDNLRKQGKPSAALEHLESLIERHGPRPEFWFRKALIGIDLDRVKVSRLNQPDLSPERSKQYFFEDVNRYAKDNYSSKVINTKEKVIYVQDSAKFSNVDWNLSFSDIDEIAPLISEGRVYRLEPGEIGDAKLGTSGIDDGVASIYLPAEDLSNATGVENGTRDTNGNEPPKKNRGIGTPANSPTPTPLPPDTGAACETDSERLEAGDPECSCAEKADSLRNGSKETYVIL